MVLSLRSLRLVTGRVPLVRSVLRGKVWTKDEVAEARNHLILFNKVYDVTEYVALHPGGDEILIVLA